METAAATLAPYELHSRCDAADGAAPVPAALSTLIRPAAIVADELGAEWAALAREAGEPNAFAERWFCAPGLRHLAAGEIRMIEVRSGRLLIGLLPVVTARRYGRLPVRNVQNWLHFHSLLGTPLIRAGHEQAFWSAVLTALDAQSWAAGFLHINGLVEQGPVHRGLAAAAAQLGRPCDVVHRTSRALLESTLSSQAYYEANVRKKKRKELKRLQSRLAERGQVTTSTLVRADELSVWCDAFLALEAAGWKGRVGSALGGRPGTEAFFREVVTAAHAAGRLEFLRLDLDARPLAMLINFVTPPGSFSFKITFDEDYARFSPGVLLQLENLRILERPDVDWMDSCAVEDHPMINSLWAERRTIVRVTVPLAGARRKAVFRLCRSAENGWAALKLLSPFRRPDPPQRADHD